MSLQKSTELKEENITATKSKKKADSKANPKAKARKQDSSMLNADKVVRLSALAVTRVQRLLPLL